MPTMETIPPYLREHAPFFCVVFDRDGVARATNRFTTALLGRDPAGRPFREVFVDFAGTLDLAALAGEPERAHRLHVSTESGLPETVDCAFHAVGGGWLALGSVDIAELRALQRQLLDLNRELQAVTRDLQKANARLEQLDALKNRFVGFAAHDLRKPVGLVQTYAEFLRDEARDRLTPEHAGFLDLIHDRALAMGRLVDDLLDLAVIESGRNEAALRLAGLAQVFATARLSVEQLAKERGVALDLALEPALPPLPLDRFKLEQAVVNLLANAIEHSPADATVRLEARRDGDTVRVTVSDAGPGIPEAMLDKLFQPFARGPERKPGGHASHGLGLAIAQRVVAAHCGRLWAENRPHGGAAFHFTLPLTAPPRTGKDQPA